MRICRPLLALICVLCLAACQGETAPTSAPAEGAPVAVELAEGEVPVELAAETPTEQAAETPIESISGGHITVDGLPDDWSNEEVLTLDPAGDGEEGFLDLTATYAFVNQNALYLLIEFVDPDAPYVQFDLEFTADGRTLLLSWSPGNPPFASDVTSGFVEIGSATHSIITLDSALEARIDFQDTDGLDHLSLREVRVMVGEDCCEYPGWRAADIVNPDPTPFVDEPDAVTVERLANAPAVLTYDPEAARAIEEAHSGESLADQTWTRLGGPLGGLGYDIRMHPDDPDLMYVTDAWAGVHISTNGGMTWMNSNSGIDLRMGPSGDAVPVFCLTIDPNHPDTIWIGLDQLGGVYRSDDGGQTWERRTNGIVERQGLSLRGISVEPGNSDVVYVSGEVASWIWAGSYQRGREFEKQRGVVYKSTDGGLSWRAIWRGDSLARYVIIDPTNVQTLYLSTGIFDREAANSDWQSDTPGGEGVLKSTDGGETWKHINNGLDNLYVGSLYMHPENPQILLAGAGNNTFREGGGIYLTTDGGESWRHVGGTHITSVEFAASDPSIAYAGGEDQFHRSDDGGQTWQQLTRLDGWRWGPDGIRTGFPIDFQVDPRDPRRIFVNNYGGGNFLSEDGGRTWVSASTGYTGADLRDVSVDPVNPAVVYVNGRSGPFRSDDGGITWAGQNWADLAEGALFVIDPTESGHVIMTSAHAGIIFESNNYGNIFEQRVNYSEAMQSLPYDDTNLKFQGAQAVAFAPSNPDRVYGGMAVWRCATDAEVYNCGAQTLYSLFISDDGGTTWMLVEGTALDGLNIVSLVVHPGDADIVWAAVPGHGVYKTTDGGQTWALASNGLYSNMVMELAIDPNNPDVLFAGTATGGVFKSEDGGESWRSSGAGMDPNEPVGTLAVDPIRPGVVYAGSWASGVFVSEDGGARWRPLNEGLRTRSVRAFAISSGGSTLYAATRGEGVFRLSTLSQGEFDELVAD